MGWLTRFCVLFRFCYLSLVSIIVPAFPVRKLPESSNAGDEYKAKETLLLR